MGALVVIELQEAPYGVLPMSRFTKDPGIKAFLVQGAVASFHLAILFGRGHRDELMADTIGVEGFSKGVGLLDVRKEYLGELRSVVGLSAYGGLDGEGEDSPHSLQEVGTGLRGVLRGDPRRGGETGAVVDDGVEVLL